MSNIETKDFVSGGNVNLSSGANFNGGDNITAGGAINITAGVNITISYPAYYKAKDENLIAKDNLVSSGSHQISHVAWWEAGNKITVNGIDSNIGKALFIDCKDVNIESHVYADNIYLLNDADLHGTLSHLHGEIHYVGTVEDMYNAYDTYFA